MTTSRAVLRRPAFRNLVLGSTISRAGNAIAPVALAFAVLDLTGSATDLGLVVGARSVANVAFVLLGGVVADRLPRWVVLVGSTLASAATQGAVALLVAGRLDSVALLAGLSAVNGAVAAFGLPASAALLPQTVRPDELVPANAVSRLGENGAAVVGASVAGVVVATAGPAWGIGADALTYVVAAGFFALVRLPATAPAAATGSARAERTDGTPGDAVDVPVVLAAEDVADAGADAVAARPSLWRDLSTGWHAFRTREWLWVVVAAFTVINACHSGAITVLGPVVADRSFGRTAWGFVLAAETVGFVLGGLVALRLRLSRLLRFGMVCMVGFGLPMLALALALPAWGVAVAFLFSGLGVEQFGVAWQATMQTHVPPELLARVSSYDMLGSFVAIPLGQVLAGPVAGAVGLSAALGGAAVLAVGAAVLSLASRDVRTLRQPATRTA